MKAIKVGDKVKNCVGHLMRRPRKSQLGLVGLMSFDGLHIRCRCRELVRGVLHGYTKRSGRTYERLNMTEAGWTPSVSIVVMLFTCADVCFVALRSAVRHVARKLKQNIG